LKSINNAAESGYLSFGEGWGEVRSSLPALRRRVPGVCGFEVYL